MQSHERIKKLKSNFASENEKNKMNLKYIIVKLYMLSDIKSDQMILTIYMIQCIMYV